VKASFPFKDFQKKLLSWYQANKRDLPWRHTKDPYAILVSELMLQQTQVKTVLPYYAKFLKLFPTAKILAKASEQEVLAAWAGLGYYRRARFLQQASQKVSELGGFPKDIEGLRSLPGVGDYTAAAVGSIAFGLPKAVVDGNVIRVLSRLFADLTDPTTSVGKKKFQAVADECLDPKNPGDFNQAMMELGATVCSPATPSCPSCPVRGLCAAFKLQRMVAYPNLPARKGQVNIEKSVLVVRRKTKSGDFVLMAPRTASGREGDRGRMLGFWHFPEVELKSGNGEKEAKDSLRAIFGKVEATGKPLSRFKHTVLHFQISLRPWMFDVPDGLAGKPWKFVLLKKAQGLPLASAEKRILGLVAAGK
jgi:A/G-specific adenine glycosylase